MIIVNQEQNLFRTVYDVADIKTLSVIADFYEISIDQLIGRRLNNNIIENPISYKSDLHKELIEILNELPTEDLYMIKGYMQRLYEKNNNNINIKKSS